MAGGEGWGQIGLWYGQPRELDASDLWNVGELVESLKDTTHNFMHA